MTPPSSTTSPSAAAAKCCRRRSAATSRSASGGYQEFAAQITSGKLRALGITSDKRLPGINIPTLKEQGINVEFINWRGLMAAPGISEAQRQELVTIVAQMVKTDQWKDTLEKTAGSTCSWPGDAFKTYVESEQKSIAFARQHARAW